MWTVVKYPSGHCSIRPPSKSPNESTYQGGAITVGVCTSLPAAEAVVRLLDRNPPGLSCT